MKKNVKLTLIGILVVLGLIIVLQNTESVRTQILFITIAMPRAILLIVTLAIGFGLGLLTAFVQRHRRR